MSKCVKQFYFLFFPTLCSNGEGFLCKITNCVGVFRETGSMNYKKGAGTVGLKKRELSKKVLSNFIKFL
jgi:hypothetical protein